MLPGGQAIPTEPAIVRDSLGRELKAGDFVRLDVANTTPYRIKSITPVPAAPHMMEIVLASQAVYISPRNQPQSEFLRVMTREEVEARQEQGQKSAPIDPPSATPGASLPPEPEPRMTLAEDETPKDPVQ